MYKTIHDENSKGFMKYMQNTHGVAKWLQACTVAKIFISSLKLCQY